MGNGRRQQARDVPAQAVEVSLLLVFDSSLGADAPWPSVRLLKGEPDDVSEYIRWDRSGRLIIIPDEKILVEKVCKVHFAQKNITSFVRSPCHLSPSLVRAC